MLNFVVSKLTRSTLLQKPQIVICLAYYRCTQFNKSVGQTAERQSSYSTSEKFIWLDILVNEILAMNELNSKKQLISQCEGSLQAKSP